jgi:putative acetyltransferase
MIELVRTTSAQPEFLALVARLDLYLAEVDGQDHAFYAQFNKSGQLKHVVVAYEDGRPVGCGALKDYAPHTAEIKRMYTTPESRGKGVATLILAELETWARELSYRKCILETGKRQPEAMALYRKNGYRVIPNYGQYSTVENSVCFEKEIT